MEEIFLFFKTQKCPFLGQPIFFSSVMDSDPSQFPDFLQIRIDLIRIRKEHFMIHILSI